MVEIVIVKDKKDMRNFITFGDKLFKGCDFYVPYYQKDIIKLFSHKRNINLISNECIAFLAYQSGKVVGRIMGIVNRVQENIDKCVKIMHFDFINDSEVSFSLLDAIKKWASTLDINKIIGPLGFNDFEKNGLLIDGYSSLPTKNESYNYPYYREHLEKYGFKIFKKYNSYKIKMKNDFKVSELYEDLELLLEKNNYRMIYGNRKFIIKNYSSKIIDLIYKNSPFNISTIMNINVYNKYLKTTKNLFDDNDYCIILNDCDEVIACVLLQSNTSLELQATCGTTMMSNNMYNVSVNKIKDLGLFIIDKDNRTSELIKIVTYYLMQNLKYKNVCYLESNTWIDDELKVILEDNFNFIKHKCRAIFEYKTK